MVIKVTFKNKNFSKFLKPSHKISVLKQRFINSLTKGRSIDVLPFGSKIKVLEKK